MSNDQSDDIMKYQLYLIWEPPEDCGEIFMVSLIWSVSLLIRLNLFKCSQKRGHSILPENWQYSTHLSQSLKHDVTWSDSLLTHAYKCPRRQYKATGELVNLSWLTQCPPAEGQSCPLSSVQALPSQLQYTGLSPRAVMSGLPSHCHYYYQDDFSRRDVSFNCNAAVECEFK